MTKINEHDKVKLTALTGLFAALITAVTLIRVPAGINGYYHAGDALIYIAALVLPPQYAVIASMIGGCMADFFAGAPEWVLFTAIIKPLTALPFIIAKRCKESKGVDYKFICTLNIFLLFVSGIVTAVGYDYIAMGILYGFNTSFILAVSSGWIQPLASAIIYVVLGAVLDKAKIKDMFFEKGKVRS